MNHFSGVLFAMTFVKGRNTKFRGGDFSWNCSRDVWGGQSDGFRMIRVRLGSREGIGRSYCGLWGALCIVHCISWSALVWKSMVWCGTVWYGMGIEGLLRGRPRKANRGLWGAVEDAWGCRPLECQSCHKTETVHRLSISEEDHIGEC